MPKDAAFTLDNNGYRYVVKRHWRDPASELHSDLRGVVAAVRAKERATGCMAVASLEVGLELASLVLGHDGNLFLPASRALAALGEHCDDAGSLRFVAGITESVGFCVFGRHTPNYKANCDALAAACRDLLEDRLTPLVKELGTNARKYVLLSKRQFVVVNDRLAAIMKAELAKGATDSPAFKREIASGWGRLQIQLAADALGERCDAELLEKWAPVFAEHYQISGTLYANYLSSVSKRKNLVGEELQNYLWDLSVAGAAGPQHAIAGRTSVLVTADKAIQRAAGQCGLTDRLLSYEDYATHFGL